MKTLVQKAEAFLEWGGVQKEIALLAVSGAALVVSIFDLLPLPFDAAWVAIVLCGVPIVLEALIGLITAFDIKADVLVSLALIASVLIGEDFAAGEVAFIMQLGALLEDVTVARARAGIEKLVRLTPQTARVVRDGGETIVPAEQVRVGDRLRVLPGESIPVDGVILSGQTSVNQAVMTGESLPVDKAAGDEVSSGTVNQYGAFQGGGGQLHPAHDPPGAVRRRGQGAHRGPGGPLGHLDCGHRPDRRGADVAGHGRDHPRGYDSGGVLPLRAGAGHAHGHHGGDRQRDPARLSGAGGRRAGTAGRRAQNRL